MSNDNSRPRIFISYKRGIKPDQPLALALFHALSENSDVFIDQTLPVGSNWADRINTELSKADYLVILLSEASVESEMVLGEIERAVQIGKQREGKPAILPIRVAFRGMFPYPLNAYLSHINWTCWSTLDDTPRIIEELRTAINSGTLHPADQDLLTKAMPEDGFPAPYAAAQVIDLEMPEGTMANDSRFYVERPTDLTALNTIKSNGVTITIKGPRQMGKSSLLVRTMNAATQHKKNTAFLDFQLIDGEALTKADIFFRQFCSWVSDSLEKPDKVAEFWDTPLGHAQRCTRYMQRHILAGNEHPIVLAMDEVDRIFGSPFRSDFFSMLRSWHNSRATSAIWRQIDLVLVTSTEPYQLIQDLNQSPFNVGQIIDLSDFGAEHIRELNRRHGGPLSMDDEAKLLALLAGQPYLTRRALYLVAQGRYTVTKLFEMAADDRGPFGDHLRYHLFRLHDKETLVQAMREVLRTSTCLDDMNFFRLRGAGLVKRNGRTVVPRCPLYRTYFQEHLHV